VQDSVIERLTEKEVEALRLVHERKTSKQIAALLGIAPQSVDKRIDSARIKLKAATRVDAANVWAKHHYGEQFPGPPFPVADLASKDDPSRAVPPVAHQRWFSARLDPKRIGPVGRTVIIIAGAAIMLMLILLSLAVADRLFAVLEYFLGPPGRVS